ncbi:MAG: RidA/YER057c/UK114 superfamily protein, partial [uncultured Cytophagales bacterium]
AHIPRSFRIRPAAVGCRCRKRPAAAGPPGHQNRRGPRTHGPVQPGRTGQRLRVRGRPGGSRPQDPPTRAGRLRAGGRAGDEKHRGHPGGGRPGLCRRGQHHHLPQRCSQLREGERDLRPLLHRRLPGPHHRGRGRPARQRQRGDCRGGRGPV